MSWEPSKKNLELSLNNRVTQADETTVSTATIHVKWHITTTAAAVNEMRRRHTHEQLLWKIILHGSPYACLIFICVCVCVSNARKLRHTQKFTFFQCRGFGELPWRATKWRRKDFTSELCVRICFFCFPPNENAFDDNNRIPRTAYLIVNDATMTKEIKWQKWREKQKNSQEKQQEDDDEKEKMEMKCSETLLV